MFKSWAETLPKGKLGEPFEKGRNQATLPISGPDD
jgi:hypothetical protein